MAGTCCRPHAPRWPAARSRPSRPPTRSSTAHGAMLRPTWPPSPVTGRSRRPPDRFWPGSLGRGALATAVDTLRRAAELLDDGEGRAEADALLVEALALAGRVDEAMVVGDRLIAQLGQGDAAAAARAEIHLRLAHAAVDGTRWEAATVHLDAAKDLLAAHPQPALQRPARRYSRRGRLRGQRRRAGPAASPTA